MSQDLKNCPQCNTEVDINAKFCMNCGHKFPEKEKEEVIEKPSEPVEVEIDDEIIDISQYFELFEDISETTDYAVNAIKESDWENALTFIDQSIEENQSNSDLWSLKSYILLKLGYLEDAITSVDVALNLNDFSQFAWACKAVILNTIGENLAAISCCNEFLILNPTNAHIIQLKLDLNDKISAGVTKPPKEEVTSGPDEKPIETPTSNEEVTSEPKEEHLETPTSDEDINPWGGKPDDEPTDIKDNPWDSGTTDVPSNPWQNGKAKDNTPWELEINPNDNYNFTGQFKNHLVNFGEIFTPENHRKLENVHLTPIEYQEILNKIKSTSDEILNKTINENNIDFSSLSILEKVLLFTKSFVDVDSKAGGADLGNYAFNKINLDDRLDTANQITTLIHELAHHLLAEIFEQSTMIIFNTDKTTAIEAYVGFSLMCADPSILLNEYCAHTVQGRFTPHGYQNYGSFENILQRFELPRDLNLVRMCMMLGNTFCQDLLSIIEPFIDYNLREEIKQQFKKDFNYPPNYQGISLEIRETLDKKELLKFINFILLTGFNEALRNPDGVFEFRRQFELHNEKGGI